MSHHLSAHSPGVAPLLDGVTVEQDTGTLLLPIPPLESLGANEKCELFFGGEYK